MSPHMLNCLRTLANSRVADSAALVVCFAMGAEVPSAKKTFVTSSTFEGIVGFMGLHVVPVQECRGWKHLHHGHEFIGRSYELVYAPCSRSRSQDELTYAEMRPSHGRSQYRKSDSSHAP